MYDFRHLTIGIAPIRRDVPIFSPELARWSKNRFMGRILEILNSISNLTLVDISWLNEDGILCDVGQVNAVAQYFIEKKVDALFIPHANFGLEEAAAKLAKKLNVPVLLWGPRDGSPDNSIPVRPENDFLDVQCGLFATGRALLRYGIPFSYIENCWIDSPILEEGIRDFIRTASVVKMMRNCRILQLGTRPRQFLSVKANEAELMEKFGIEVTPVDTVELEITIDDALKHEGNKIDLLIEEWKNHMDFSSHTPEQVKNMAAYEIAILKLLDKYDCTSAASTCWQFYKHHYGVRACFVFGDLTQKGVSVSCECDILGAVSSAIINAVTRMETPSFLADMTVRHPQNDNAELLWHCGPFPYSLAKDKDKKLRVDEGRGYFEIKGGTLTLCRFESTRGKYYLFADTAKGVEGPGTYGNYIWVETKDWPKWEKRLVYGPYIHHIVGAHGNYKKALHDACAYLDIIPDSID